MARPPSTQPTDGELEILNILWDAGPLDLGAVRTALKRKRPVAPTTVATMLKLMRQKGLVERSDGPRQYQENSGSLKPGEETIINGLYDAGRVYWFGSRFEFQPRPASNVP